MSDDYNSLKEGDVSSNAMAYVFEFIISGSHVNLMNIANDIISGNEVHVSSNITKKMCFIPYRQNDNWQCFIIDCKKSTFQHIRCGTSDSDFNWTNKLEMFISSYNNDTTHRSKLRHIKFWKGLPALHNSVVSSMDSGIFVIDQVYSLINGQKTNSFDCATIRHVLMKESLKYSDDVSDICVTCGEHNDSSTDTIISWTICTSCERSFHDNCMNPIMHPIIGDYTCTLCEECNFEYDLSMI